MESPAYWPTATRIIQKAIDEYNARPVGFCGYSLAMAITVALEEAGELDYEERVEHNHFTREIIPDHCPACANTKIGRAMLTKRPCDE